jgi:uroporphyrinogen III methyltransferase / synthase
MHSDREATLARRGIVYLVGAGPGDPGLLTVRGRDLLQLAEVVAHDELVAPAILALVAPGAELLAVGRRRGSGPTSYRLHPAVLERARAGKRVVRLKAGDPFVFGRGGEEAEELVEAGIAFEIIPGVSAALGAASYAGIPLTHRRHASSVTFATGHHSQSDEPIGAQDRHGTLVLYMAAHDLASNLRRVIQSGRAATTPAAYIAAATTPEQQVIVGTLATLAEQTHAVADATAPALLIIGEVVRLRPQLSWFEPAPLAGKTLLLGRARPGPSQIAAELRRLGAEVVETPHVEAVALPSQAFGHAAQPTDLHRFRAVVFACAASVDSMPAQMREEMTGAAKHAVRRAPAVIAIGAPAGAALRRRGIVPSVDVRGACDQALRAQRASFADGPLLLITAQGGRPGLQREFAALGIAVEVLEAYRYQRRDREPPLPPIDLVVLPSSSAAHAVLSGALGIPLRQLPMVVMGARTEATARSYGAQYVVRAHDDSSIALVAMARATIRNL